MSLYIECVVMVLMAQMLVGAGDIIIFYMFANE